MMNHPVRADANSLESQWMPFTPNKAFKKNPRLITASSGMYYTNHQGESVIDGSSALFCCPAGLSRPEIADAVHQQMLSNTYSAPFGLGHPAAFSLSETVARLLPDPMNHVFFANSGSEAIDTALKIALAYHRARGEGHRTRIVSRERAYHGVNMGGVALSGMVKNRETFNLTLPNIVHMRHTWQPENKFVRGQAETGGVELANDLQRACETFGGSTIAAVFVEPVAGSTGTLVPPKGYLERLREICDLNGILLVFDEVITGFGRLGTPFAADYFGVTPDIITMAKALTNAAIPMGAVGVRDEIYDTVVNASPENAIEMFHGYTYGGHPAACAAGIAAQEIYVREGLFEKSAAMSEYFLDGIYSLKDHAAVFDIRGIGMMAGVELKQKGNPGAAGGKAQLDLYNNGMHVKFTGETGIIAPPFISERKHIDEMIEKLQKTLDQQL